jgi:hypothetical protein
MKTMTKRRAAEARGSLRVGAAVPVRIAGSASATTRDISPTGVYFVGQADPRVGEIMRFTLEFDDPSKASGKLLLACTGSVVRVEDLDGRSGVAVAITDSRLERMEE